MLSKLERAQTGEGLTALLDAARRLSEQQNTLDEEATERLLSKMDLASRAARGEAAELRERTEEARVGRAAVDSGFGGGANSGKLRVIICGSDTDEGSRSYKALESERGGNENLAGERVGVDGCGDRGPVLRDVSNEGVDGTILLLHYYLFIVSP
jgi:hypothetical protein